MDFTLADRICHWSLARIGDDVRLGARMIGPLVSRSLLDHARVMAIISSAEADLTRNEGLIEAYRAGCSWPRVEARRSIPRAADRVYNTTICASRVILWSPTAVEPSV